jgi:hypothetical protein
MSRVVICKKAGVQKLYPPPPNITENKYVLLPITLLPEAFLFLFVPHEKSVRFLLFCLAHPHITYAPWDPLAPPLKKKIYVFTRSTKQQRTILPLRQQIYLQRTI